MEEGFVLFRYQDLLIEKVETDYSKGQYLCFVVLISNTLTKVIGSVPEGLCQHAEKANVKQPKISVQLFRS